MATSVRAKRALIAYSVLAERLRTPGVSLTSAMNPFWAEVCAQFSNDLFDAAKFASKAEEMYGFKIPRLAVLGMAEQLAKDGLILVKTQARDLSVYEYPKAPRPSIDDATHSLTEREVLRILSAFIEHARTDESLSELRDEDLHNAFLDRLLNLDSMRILARKDASTTVKKTGATITLNKPQAIQDRVPLHLDFLVSDFLLDLRDKVPSDFEKVSDIAFANMTAEAVTCFNEPSNSSSNLSSLTVYLDSPLLLDMLGVNSEYTVYGKELLALIQTSGARPAVLDHCIAEAESAVHAQLAHLRSGINNISYGWGTSARPDLLSALCDHVADRAHESLAIEIHKEPTVELHKANQSAVGSIDNEMTRRMQAWRNAEAKEYDRKSVWAMLGMRDTGTIISRICDSSTILLTRNTALVSIANSSWNSWLNETTRHSHSLVARSAPIAMSDKQFAGYLWARTGGLPAAISKTRLLAHCSSAVRPRSDVKARAYNLVLELSGQEEATYVMALLEDREGAVGLMKATRGDPADVTPERLPYIMEQVKLAAGEFAAEKERERGEGKLIELKKTLDEEKAAVALALERTKAKLAEQGAEANNLKSEVDNLIQDNTAKRHYALLRGLSRGIFTYTVARWAITIIFGAATVFVSQIAPSVPTWLSVVLGAVVAVAGFWFVPDLLSRHIHKLANILAKRKVADLDPHVVWPQSANFQSRSLTDLDGTVLSLGKQENAS